MISVDFPELIPAVISTVRRGFAENALFCFQQTNCRLICVLGICVLGMEAPSPLW